MFVFNWAVSNVCIPEKFDLKHTEVGGGSSLCFGKSDPESSGADLGFLGANTALMLSSSYDPLTFCSAIKSDQCERLYKANVEAGFIQFPHQLAK